MATVIRPDISEKNKYWISKHNYYELKHFCLQYPLWKKLYSNLDTSSIPISIIERFPKTNIHGDSTAKRAIAMIYCRERMELIEQIAMKTDEYLYPYILKAVTEGVSYTYLKSRLGMPCSRDTYYNRYRKFFWLLSQERD